MQNQVTPELRRALDAVMEASLSDSDPRCQALLERASAIIDIVVSIKTDAQPPLTVQHAPAATPQMA